MKSKLKSILDFWEVYYPIILAFVSFLYCTQYGGDTPLKEKRWKEIVNYKIIMQDIIMG